MSELLVRVKDRTHKDFYIDCGLTKRGDVIAVCPDGWNWGTEEISNPDWRIIKTDLTEDEASVFLSPERDKDPTQPSRTLQFRAFKIDLDSLDDFFTDHEVIPITSSSDLKDIEIKEEITSVLEDIKIVDGTSVIETKTTTRERIIYPKEALDTNIKDKLSIISVTKTGATIRKNVAVEISGVTIETLKVEKKSIEDPNILGGSNNIF
jgi:CxxC motif-containing protein